MEILQADKNDISDLYELQMLAFESEAEMAGSRKIPALMESREENEADFSNWVTLKLVDDAGTLAGAIRYKIENDIIEVGRLMIHPKYRRQGYAKQLLRKIDSLYPEMTKELYTCTKSWLNIRLYEKMGYTAYKEENEGDELPKVYMRK